MPAQNAWAAASPLIPEGKSQATVACAGCGEPVDLIDRYLSDFPPGPRGKNPDSWLEIYREDSTDPDDRLFECPGCGADLDPTDASCLKAVA